jgi:hypothetical protein
LSTSSGSPVPFGGVASNRGSFWNRKVSEDVAMNEKIQVNAAIRMKDSLLQQISELEAKIKEDKAHHQQELHKYALKEKGYLLAQQILSHEVTKLLNKVSYFHLLRRT